MKSTYIQIIPVIQKPNIKCIRIILNYELCKANPTLLNNNQNEKKKSNISTFNLWFSNNPVWAGKHFYFSSNKRGKSIFKFHIYDFVFQCLCGVVVITFA